MSSRVPIPSVTVADPTLPGTTSTAVFVVVCLSVATVIAWFHRASSPSRSAAPFAVAGAWLVATGAAAAAGIFASLAGTPKLGIFPLASNLAALALALGSAGRHVAARTPVAWLVGLQVLRLPLEFVLHRWYVEGAVPAQMTFSGANFDIVTGMLALVVAATLAATRTGRAWRWWLVAGFNLVGVLLLFRVMAIAVRSVP